MAVTYDPQVIVTFAERLYKRADSIVSTHAIIGFAVGGVMGAAIGNAVGTQNALILGAVLGAALGSFGGAAIGETKAFVLRLQAQQALCQVQIELNTRQTAATPVAPSASSSSVASVIQAQRVG